MQLSANWNYFEISSFTSQNGQSQKNKQSLKKKPKAEKQNNNNKAHTGEGTEYGIPIHH